MALDKIIQRDAAPSAVDLTDALYTFAALNDSGELEPPAAGGRPHGVIYEGAAAGNSSSVAVFGFVKVKAGTPLTIGDEVATDASGKAVVAASGNFVVGRVRYAASAANAIATVQITHEGVKA